MKVIIAIVASFILCTVLCNVCELSDFARGVSYFSCGFINYMILKKRD